MISANKVARLQRNDQNLTISLSGADQRPPGPGEVQIRVLAASVNFRDLLVLQNGGGDTKDGLIPLSDAAGIVTAIGEGVQNWIIGDRVSPTFFAAWRTGPFRQSYLASALGGGQTDGVASSFITACSSALVAIPDGMLFVEAATLPCAGVTAWQALFARGDLQPDETVLIQGTGGVALFALQLAVARGARAIVLSPSDEKLEKAKALGAWRGLNYLKRPAWDADVLDLTEGLGADHIIELGGPETFDRSIASVGAGGQIAQIGVLTGFGPTPNLLPLQFKNARIDGVCVGSGEHHADLAAFMTKSGIHPVVERIFPLEELAEAYGFLKGAGHFGKIVIDLEGG